MKYQIALFYGYEEGESGTWHSFSAEDPECIREHGEIETELADQLGLEAGSDNFSCDYIFINLPDTLVERIKMHGVVEYFKKHKN